MQLPRSILIYLLIIGVPVCVLVWLGLQSFERQREALAALTAEKVAAELQRREAAAVESTLKDGHGPVAKYFFQIDLGVVSKPALTAPLPDPLPEEFQEADQLEFAGQIDAALARYRQLETRNRPALALSRIARCLEKLGRDAEAKAAWKNLAARYPDDRDLFHRPYGVVAAMAAGETMGLAEQITAGRWVLSADLAEYFLFSLVPGQPSSYLDQFRFARKLQEQFHPVDTLHEGELYSMMFGDDRIYYRLSGPDHVDGLVIDPAWINTTLRPQIERNLGLEDDSRRQVLVYGAAIVIVLAVLSTGVVLLLRDVSREARTNSLRADFVSGVSHELKTPITLIRLYGDTLLERPEIAPDERAAFYRIIVRESERLTRLVNQVLTFGRVERGGERYAMDVEDLAATITPVVNDYADNIRHAGFILHREISSSTPVVRFDRAAVPQAVTNLLDNAVKYSGERHEITARLGTHDACVVFEVEDHGCGIPAGEREKIFERFYRVANGNGKGGYGLGLYLVRKIMQAHGGRVEVSSEPGRGSTFRLIFPVAHP